MPCELNQIEIEEVLNNNSIGRLGYTDSKDIYIVPMNYRYNSNTIQCYSLEGKKIEMMRKNPSVCFEIDEIIDSNHWKTVVINGQFEEITDENELVLLRPIYTEYMLRKKVTLNPSSGIEEDPSLHTKQIFYRINLQKSTGRIQNGLLT